MTNPVVALGSGSELLLRIGAIATVVLVAALVSWRRRTTTAAPTQPRGAIPAQLDRSDFDSPEMPWLVVVFTSATCSACEDVARKASVLVGRKLPYKRPSTFAIEICTIGIASMQSPRW